MRLVAPFDTLRLRVNQDRRPRRRNEDDDPAALPDLMPRSEYPALRSATHPAPRHLRDGREPQNANPSRSTRKPPPTENLAPKAGAEPVRPDSAEITQSRRKP